jgi:hypothetical protein
MADTESGGGSKSAVAAYINPFAVVIGSLSFVGGLAWNDAIQAGIKQYYPVTKDPSSKDVMKNVRAKFAYALIVTIIIVLIAAFLKYANDATVQLANEAEKYEKVQSISKQYATG